MKGFIYSCIGDNTPENREHLEKLGYTMSMVTMDKAIYLKTQANRKYYETNNDDWSKVITNCIGNPLLFQAVTAIQDKYIGTAYLQWFVCHNDIWRQCLDRISEDVFIQKINKEDHEHYHKATPAELKEHFK